MNCSLCNGPRLNDFAEAGPGRRYFRCDACDLILLDPKQRLRPELERARYETHENGIENQGYVDFLSQLADPLLERIEKSSVGLDFGAGPGPTLSKLLSQRGHQVSNYDPFFANDPNLLKQTYDFVTATEVFEHLFSPGKDIEKIVDLLKTGGLLGIMTLLWKEEGSFGDWYYAKDPTHVSFFTPKTFEWIAHRFGLSRIYPKASPTNVLIFRKEKAIPVKPTR